jgi:hypothetical protein
MSYTLLIFQPPLYPSSVHITAVNGIVHLILFVAVFKHVLSLHALTWSILWLEEEWKELALLLPLFAQKL